MFRFLCFWILLLLLLVFGSSMGYSSTLNPPIIYPFPNVDALSHRLIYESGDAFQLDCNARGKNLVITWTKNGTLLEKPSHGSRFEGAILDFYDPMVKGHSGDYQCWAENEVGRAFSDIAIVRGKMDEEEVPLEGGKLPPRILRSPKNTEALLGELVEMICTARDLSKETVFTWTRNGEVIMKGTNNPSVYRIEALRPEDMGSYACNASNSAGYDLRGAYLSVVREAPLIDLLPTDGIFHPQNYTTSVYMEYGGNLTCFLLDGFPSPAISWSFNSEPIDPAPLWNKDTLSSIHNVTKSGVYSCEASNDLGSDYISLNVTLLTTPLILEGPANVSASLGGFATFNCSVIWIDDEELKMEISWAVDDIYLDLEEDEEEAERMRILPNGALEIFDLELEDQGKYTCTASSSMGINSASAYLSVSSNPPRILSGPPDTTIASGASVVLPCIPEEPSKVTISWSSDSHRDLYSNNRISIDSTSLQISDVRPSDSGLYTCRVFSELEEEYDEMSAFLNVRTATVIVQEPENFVYYEGRKNVAMDCVVEVDEFLSSSLMVQWFKDGDTLLRVEDGWDITQNGTLIIDELTVEKIGSYTCKASTSVDSVSASGRIYKSVLIGWLIVGATFAFTAFSTLLIILCMLRRRYVVKKRNRRECPIALDEDFWLERGMGEDGSFRNGLYRD